MRELFAKAAANEQGLETSMEALESKVISCLIKKIN